jgi:hypothetical protein
MGVFAEGGYDYLTLTEKADAKSGYAATFNYEYSYYITTYLHAGLTFKF